LIRCSINKTVGNYLLEIPGDEGLCDLIQVDSRLRIGPQGRFGNCGANRDLVIAIYPRYLLNEIRLNAYVKPESWLNNVPTTLNRTDFHAESFQDGNNSFIINSDSEQAGQTSTSQSN
jgi:hypothetical protein